jgi:hypothetical protein
VISEEYVVFFVRYNNKSLFCIVCRTINTILYCKQDIWKRSGEISFKLSLTSTDFVRVSGVKLIGTQD